MKMIIAAVLLLLPTNVLAADFSPPPRLNLALGLLMDYESGIYTEVLQPETVMNGCGDRDGCFLLNGGSCVIKISVVLPAMLRKLVWEHLAARCAGWTP